MSAAKSPSYPVGTIAKLLMISERRVQQLTKEGVIPKGERGRYDLAPAVQGYIRYLQDRAVGGASKGPIDFHVEKARLTKAQADTAEIELAQAKREVVSVDQVQRTLSNLFAEVRANMRNIPARVVSSLIGMTDEREFKNVLLQEIDITLEALANSDVVIDAAADDDIDEGDGEL